jgi:hypothetical protein
MHPFAQSNSTADAKVTVTADSGKVVLAATATVQMLANGSYEAVVTIANTGKGTAQKVTMSAATLGGVAPVQTLPVCLPDIAPGGSISTLFDNSSITDVGSVFTLNDTDFFSNFPTYLTPTGPDDTYTGAIFTITNTGSVAEKYSGDFNLLGGANGSASKTLATVDFGSPAVTVTPEPSSVLLLSTGMLGLVLVGRRKLVSTL